MVNSQQYEYLKSPPPHHHVNKIPSSRDATASKKFTVIEDIIDNIVHW